MAFLMTLPKVFSYRRARRAIMALVIAVVLLPCRVVPAKAEAQLYEPKIEAGLIYNFLKYTSWPHHLPGKGVLRVCLLNGDPFNGYLDPLQGRTAQQSRIDILHIDSYTQMDGCQLLFIPAHMSGDLPQIIAYAKSKPILTVSNAERFIESGGMVEFAMREDQRIHLYIGATALRAANMAISPRLLLLAEKAPR
jgi:hypothetical protein